MVCFQILVEVTEIQGELLQLTGSTVDISTLGSSAPTLSPLPQLPSAFEALLEQELSILQETLTINFGVIQILQQILIGGFTISQEGQSCDLVFSSVFRFFTLLVRAEYGQELTSLGNDIMSFSIGGVINLSGSCSADALEAFSITISAVEETNVNIVATMTKMSQTLVVSRGLIVKVVSTSVSFEEQANQLATTLKVNRMNCEGADRVGARLLEFLGCTEAVQECNAGADLKALLDAVMQLMSALTKDLEGTDILQRTEAIVSMIGDLDVPCISVSIKIRIQTVVISIQDVVATYVSQISLVEQRRLQITGSLNFSLSVTLDQEPQPFDFQLKERVQRQQLKGLMICGDFTDRSTESILVSQQVSDPSGGDCDGETILRRAQRVTAMCGANDLQLDDIRSNTQELARCSANLREPLTERQQKSLKFILVILSSFRVTFSSQISFVLQKLSILTGQKVSSAELGIQFIGSDGELFDVEAVREVVPLNPLGQPGEAAKYEIILTQDWQNLRFVFTTIKTVILSVVRVLNVQGISDQLIGDSVACSDFLNSIQIYFTMISQGRFSQDDIYDIALKIITSGPKVGVECSSRVRFLAESILKSVMNYQLLFTTDLVVLQMKLLQILRVQVTSLQITFAGFSEQGSLVDTQQGLACDLRDKDFYRETISRHQNSIENVRDLCDLVSALIEPQGTTVIPSASNSVVSSSEFMETLGPLVVSLSEDANSLDAENLSFIQSLSVNTSFSDREKSSLASIKTTLVSITVQLGAEMAMVRSELQDLDNQEGKEVLLIGTDMEALQNNATTIASLTEKLLQISKTIEEAKDSCSPEKPKDSEEFFDFVLDNILLPLARADLRDDIQPDSSLWDMIGPLEDYLDRGIKCLKGSDEGSLLVTQAVLKTYVDMLNLDLAILQGQMLELEGTCPPGFEPGDWSNGSGECCCNRDINLGDGSTSGTRPANSSIEICYEKKVCECRSCLKPCLFEKISGLFASFEALDNSTKAIDSVLNTCSSSSSVSTGVDAFIQALNALMELLTRYSPRDLFRFGILELTLSAVTTP